MWKVTRDSGVWGWSLYWMVEMWYGFVVFVSDISKLQFFIIMLVKFCFAVSIPLNILKALLVVRNSQNSPRVLLEIFKKSWKFLSRNFAKCSVGKRKSWREFLNLIRYNYPSLMSNTVFYTELFIKGTVCHLFNLVTTIS